MLFRSGPGMLVGNTWCYTPVADEIINVTLRAQDTCGYYTDKSFRIVFDINTAPVLVVPPDDSIFQCIPTEVCLPFTVSDEDGNYNDTQILTGPGTLVGNTWCYAPAADEIINVTLRAQDT